jgi:hypothetical protein
MDMTDADRTPMFVLYYTDEVRLDTDRGSVYAWYRHCTGLYDYHVFWTYRWMHCERVDAFRVEPLLHFACGELWT